ncbi:MULTISPECIES: hypothetical protein [Mycobacterium]|uniref:Uncharacterized protein n=1 Tax=Mycobacterium kubicae TaxID=120959 RepID=A0AAX1JIS1_9MYCO|nr:MULTISPECIES: hypothetical protein [Mycobacterium]MCV7094202.1 hypothetical protein [Mycobacterium kubicae]ORW05878.1 hypothetical protein AWC13_24445 [Mycobacterium kubicae]PBA33954.1 hypothetical protein CKJ64_24445 [Mycobacterium avium]PBA53214.1 hypothetical protein CKJ57_27260 [Mycobacterium intracellulare subsp. chimaera]PBA58530.1 hypothetical protein CKJ56_27195 [Mycobacterium intracellulare subsp. chimaera]
MYKHLCYASTAIIVVWLLFCTYALVADKAAELHDISATTVDIIHALITQPIHDLATAVRTR